MSISFSSAFSYLAVALAASKNETLISPYFGRSWGWRREEASEILAQVQSVKSFREHVFSYMLVRLLAYNNLVLSERGGKGWFEILLNSAWKLWKSQKEKMQTFLMVFNTIKKWQQYHILCLQGWLLQHFLCLTLSHLDRKETSGLKVNLSKCLFVFHKNLKTII